MEMLNKKQKILVIGAIAIVIIVIAYYYINSTKEVYNYENFDVSTNEEDSYEDKEEREIIVIHITGAVKKEGIVHVKENARINDVIGAARRSHR